MFQTEALFKEQKLRSLFFSVMITWALENAIETADSMKTRGYGLKGRTAFSIYTFDERDKALFCWLAFCCLFLVSGNIISAFGFRYFPNIRYAAIDLSTFPFYLVYLCMSLTPFILNLKEERAWKILYSKI